MGGISKEALKRIKEQMRRMDFEQTGNMLAFNCYNPEHRGMTDLWLVEATLDIDVSTKYPCVRIKMDEARDHAQVIGQLTFSVVKSMYAVVKAFEDSHPAKKETEP